MKVEADGYGEWNILSNGKVVGEIRTIQGFHKHSKSLYVNDKQVCEITNQKEAIEKLQKFFAENKKAIQRLEQQIEELTIGITQVLHQICIDTLVEKREKVYGQLEVIKSYDLI